MTNSKSIPNLRPLWDAVLEVYREFDRICQKYGIEFTAIGGTAIGAVRHRGFIPWDDDLDLGMKIEDFERFRNVAQSELPPHLKLVTWDNTAGYQNLFAKIVDLRLDRLAEIRKESGLPIGQGVFVDLFIVSGIPDSLVDRARIYFSTLYLNAVHNYSLNGFNCTSPAALAKRTIGWICSGFTRKKISIKEFLERQWNLAVNRQTILCTRSGSYYGVSNRLYYFVVPTRCFDKTIRVVFDKVTMPLCIGFDEVVRAEYSDYLQLPPEEERVLRHADQMDAPWLNLEFGE